MHDFMSKTKVKILKASITIQLIPLYLTPMFLISICFCFQKAVALHGFAFVYEIKIISVTLMQIIYCLLTWKSIAD